MSKMAELAYKIAKYGDKELTRYLEDKLEILLNNVKKGGKHD